MLGQQPNLAVRIFMVHGLTAVTGSVEMGCHVANLSDLPFQKGILRVLTVTQMF